MKMIVLDYTIVFETESGEEYGVRKVEKMYSVFHLKNPGVEEVDMCKTKNKAMSRAASYAMVDDMLNGKASVEYTMRLADYLFSIDMLLYFDYITVKTICRDMKENQK